MSKSLIIVLTLVGAAVVFFLGLFLLRKGTGMKGLKISFVDGDSIVTKDEIKAAYKEQQIKSLQEKITKLSK